MTRDTDGTGRSRPAASGPALISLGDLSPPRFLAEVWQRRPLLVRDALPGFDGPLDMAGLAALAAEEAVESRLVRRRRGAGPGGSDDWTVEDGPFAGRRLGRLGARDWTLLVQSVDAWLPEVARLAERFAFLPAWRRDDVMVSYAATGGGVGPHVDRYDVFLLQGRGRRLWRIGPPEGSNGPERDHPRLRLLAAMPVAEEHVLGPGDMLYLPPGVAHDGEALEPCVTYSIGLRAPAIGALATALAQEAAMTLGADALYRDPEPPIQDNPGEISPAALAEARRLVLAALADPDLAAAAFAQEVTDPKVPAALPLADDPVDGADVAALLADGATIERPGSARLAYVETADGVVLYANGVRYDCPGPLAGLARGLAGAPAHAPVAVAPWSADAEACVLIADLLNDGALTVA